MSKTPPRVARLIRVIGRRDQALARCQVLLEKIARIDVDAQSAEHAANLAVHYGEEARQILRLIKS